jgi:hypothetical protein
MRLDPATLEDLAIFYARRLPDGAAGMARTCRLTEPTEPGVDGWRALLTTAEESGRTGALAAEIARHLPDDENAQEAAAGLAVKRSWISAGATVGALACAAAIGLIVLMSTGQAQADVVSPSPSAPTIGTEVAHPEATTPAPAVAPKLAPAPETAPKLAPAPKTAPAIVPASEVASAPKPAQATLRPSSRVPRAGCTAAPGATIGWWYAGESAPGATGDTITLQRGANVRAAVPGADTRWRLAAPVGCGLEAGDTITIGAIQAIPGGVWVELRG